MCTPGLSIGSALFLGTVVGVPGEDFTGGVNYASSPVERFNYGMRGVMEAVSRLGAVDGSSLSVLRPGVHGAALSCASGSRGAPAYMLVGRPSPLASSARQACCV